MYIHQFYDMILSISGVSAAAISQVQRRLPQGTEFEKTQLPQLPSVFMQDDSLCLHMGFCSVCEGIWFVSSCQCVPCIREVLATIAVDVLLWLLLLAFFELYGGWACPL
ncbi:unnamed protein product [Polarella glacialis]|uniref:Uncharacterized protein n=1 Tax=Polarella glacialis TaxID=89957 RepID=A0A813FQP3_POLGL|nr:unnamed protein product [Polarella glacialis]